MRAAVCPGGGDVRPCSVYLHVFKTQAMAGIVFFSTIWLVGYPRSDFNDDRSWEIDCHTTSRFGEIDYHTTRLQAARHGR